MYSLDTKRILVSRDVLFYENHFLFNNSHEATYVPLPLTGDQACEQDDIAPNKHPQQIQNNDTDSLRQSTRERRAPTWLKDYVVNSTVIKEDQFEKIPPVKAPTAYTPHTFLYNVSSHLNKTYVNFLTNLSTITEPNSFEQAKRNNDWEKAMQEEIKALEENGTWVVTELPPRKLAIGCKWVIKIKRKPYGNIDRYKAILEAKGFHQVEGIDYNESFSPVAKLVTICVLLAVATASKWGIHHIDINNVFLHGFLDEEVYMLPPQGYTKVKPGQVCKLRRSLYGLKQAGRQWNIELCYKLQDYGFIQSTADHCLFS